jgi:hypothetical protein
VHLASLSFFCYYFIDLWSSMNYYKWL